MTLTAEETTRIDQELSAMAPGELLYAVYYLHRYVIVRTTEKGIHSGRPRYFVACTTCDKLLHEATTGPACRIEQHFTDVSRDPR